jgi:hypothetical protein
VSANNTFGRRRLPERTTGLSESGKPAPLSNLVAAEGSNGGGSVFNAPPVRQSAAVMVGVGIVLFLGLVYFVAMKGFGKALDQHWQQNVGYPGVEDAYKRVGRADASLESIHNDCKSRSDFVRLDNSQSRALEGFDGLYSGEAALAKAAFYLSCLAAEKPARLCQQVHRAHLVAALKDYYRLMGRVREERMLTTSSPFASERAALMGAPGREHRATTPPPSAQTDERVVNGLRMLIVNGYLSRADLAPVLGPPGDLDLALRGAEAKRAGCA